MKSRSSSTLAVVIVVLLGAVIVLGVGPIGALLAARRSAAEPGARAARAAVTASHAGADFDRFRAAVSAFVAARTPTARRAIMADLTAARRDFDRDMAKAAAESPDLGPRLRAILARGDAIIDQGCTRQAQLDKAATSAARSPRAQIAFFTACTGPIATFQQTLDANQRRMVQDLVTRSAAHPAAGA